jgi:hypothetical protein
VNPRAIQRGEWIARTLRGAWRPEKIPLQSVDLEHVAAILPSMVRSGSAGLLWRRLSVTDGGSEHPQAESLRHCYWKQALDDGLRSRQIAEVAAALATIGIVPVLIKGWSVARAYPEQGLRPYCDIDLVVDPTRAADARARLREVPVFVDLHVAIPYAGDEARRRLQRVSVGGAEIDLLSEEDQLRLLCLHLLNHGASRPIWLCDIAVLLETSSAGFDWDYFFTGGVGRPDALRASLALAAEILGALVDHVPMAGAGLPRWLPRSLLAEWGGGFEPLNNLDRLPRTPRGLLREARLRWPNPILATAALDAPYDDSTRLPLQIVNYLSRTARFFRRQIHLFR